MAKIIDLKDKLGNKLFPIAIVESGTNVYGTYFKFSNGLMITFRITDEVKNASNGTAWGSLYVGYDRTERSFPASFKEPPFILWDIVPTGNRGIFKVYENTVGYELTVTKDYAKNFGFARHNQVSDISYKIYILAIGWWK